MPTVLRRGPYQFIFFSSNGVEPIHVHVRRDQNVAKFWLDPVSLDVNKGFRGHEINQILRMIHENREKIVEAWHDYFGA